MSQAQAAAVAAPDEKETKADLLARDSLRILPLSCIPLETAPLQRARIVKNLHLQGVVEMFQDESTGSGQLEPDQLPTYFGWDPNKDHADLTRIRALSSLSSYDVYSLRIELRRLGIDVNDHKALTLSEDKSKELAGHMKSFTGPLLQQVYGSGEENIQDFGQLVGLFASPNKAEAQKNLKKLADKLEIDLIEVPAFLEDYADTFLSLAYFKDCLDDVVPKVMSFLENIGDLRSNLQLQRTTGFLETCDFMEPRLNSIITSITGRFERFDQHTKNLWDDVSATSFQRIRRLIKSHHKTVGGVLCGMSTKMDAWEAKFGTNSQGAAVVARADFIMSDMRHGIVRLEEIEKSAPDIAEA
ncbi:hypothetical protein [Pelagibius sp. Alg239-R121]|uniref:hypothetical protein n=1 Tax=Pelagibius sp. Alg239-R121 TaxID=2993448 RepID=UPI0024A6959C|nr:hypothetical protein [Pelagibius sp. Alg239-R121]